MQYRPGKVSVKRQHTARKRCPKILICCCGIVTEYHYFIDFVDHHKIHLIEVVIEAYGDPPHTLVEKAIELNKQAEKKSRQYKDINEAYDQVWCVYDVDIHPRLDYALEMAEKAGILLAVSNPCLELWALVHFEDQTAHLERGNAQDNLRKYIPGYSKRLPFYTLLPYYKDAVLRAIELFEKNSYDNPSTSVYKLTETLLLACQ